MTKPLIIPLLLLLFGVILGGCVSLYTQVCQATAEATPHNAWKTYKADSGYEIRYPLAAYSIRPVAARPLMRSDEFVYPGVLALEPNDRFFYDHAGQITYKITIGVTANTRNWSLDQHQQELLAENPLAPYDPASLTGHPVEEITLAGEPALWVGNVTEGPLNLRREIISLRHGLIYILLVEPYLPPPNQAEPYVSPQPNAETEAVVEEILSTFEFIK